MGSRWNEQDLFGHQIASTGAILAALAVLDRRQRCRRRATGGSQLCRLDGQRGDEQGLLQVNIKKKDAEYHR